MTGDKQPLREKMDKPMPMCVVCGEGLSVRLARGRKSQKPFLMLGCARDGRHFRGFISDKAYVGQVLARLEAKT